ncbi:hypothetical protein DSCO28_14310 [Desulfosarcina ovata subsp. sediminis]|uniref:DUF4189 domain-containing protein n=1 Tax=Desulfosarcina ovata subsp. sediminis TaxID=885957 RepID=A0A5K7ZKT6_9BACT|nr:substrate-binding domain-containing protein [Desulfosarcina ovata]BBO80865.1 hypothetical protein DSCO28_14310 [Desulfosarcina ovata subsp. sediminis]
MNLSKSMIVCFILMSVFMKSFAFAEGLTFGLVAKSVNDGNFIDAWKGCNEAAKRSGDECVLLGGKGAAQLRLQEVTIREAIQTKRFDALAISVIRSDFVARAVQDATIPIIKAC